MNPEGRFTPNQEPTLSTPESIQECIDLEQIITTQIEVWQSRLRSPAMRAQNMALFINGDCQPLGREPKDYLPEADFGGTRTREEAIFMNEYEKRREVLSSWVDNEDIEAAEVLDPVFNVFFTDLEETASNPHTPEESKRAFQILKRLYILREQVAAKITPKPEHDNTVFISLFNRLLNDLP